MPLDYSSTYPYHHGVIVKQGTTDVFRHIKFSGFFLFCFILLSSRYWPYIKKCLVYPKLQYFKLNLHSPKYFRLRVLKFQYRRIYLFVIKNNRQKFIINDNLEVSFMYSTRNIYFFKNIYIYQRTIWIYIIK